MKNEVASTNIENDKYEETYLLAVTAALAETRSSTRDPAAVEKTRSLTWDHSAVGAATSNCQVGQEGVAWSSADVLDVDVAAVGAWSDVAAAGGAAAAAGAEQLRFSGCT